MRSKCSAKSPKDAGEHADAKLLRQVARRKIKFLSLTSLQGADIRARKAASFQESGGEVVLAQLDGGAHHGVADAPERAELGVMASVQLLDVGSRHGFPEDEARALFEQGRTVAAGDPRAPAALQVPSRGARAVRRARTGRPGASRRRTRRRRAVDDPKGSHSMVMAPSAASGAPCVRCSLDLHDAPAVGITDVRMRIADAAAGRRTPISCSLGVAWNAGTFVRGCTTPQDC